MFDIGQRIQCLMSTRFISEWKMCSVFCFAYRPSFATVFESFTSLSVSDCLGAKSEGLLLQSFPCLWLMNHWCICLPFSTAGDVWITAWISKFPHVTTVDLIYSLKDSEHGIRLAPGWVTLPKKMVHKFLSFHDAFNFCWEDVSRGFWRRYPNPHASHVLSEDVISRRINPDGKHLFYFSLSSFFKQYSSKLLFSAHYDWIHSSIHSGSTIISIYVNKLIMMIRLCRHTCDEASSCEDKSNSSDGQIFSGKDQCNSQNCWGKHCWSCFEGTFNL